MEFNPLSIIKLHETNKQKVMDVDDFKGETVR